MLSYWILLSLSALYIRAQPRGGPHAHIFNRVFNLFDQNGDNVVTAQEFHDNVPSADVDGDGIITEDEFIDAWESITGHTPEEEEENKHSAELLFEQVTSTTLSVNEQVRVFKVFDTNNDGVVSRDEFLHEWERIHPEHDDYTSKPYTPLPPTTPD